MRNFQLFFIAFLFIWGLAWGTAQAQGQYWGRHAGGVTTDEATDISVDASGNTYTTGHFTGSASFGSINLSSSGVTDVFISKTDPNGFFLWAIKAGGSGSDRALSIKTDLAGNSYITGYFYGTATFGTQTLTSAGVQDIFVAKYDNTGTFVWAASAGGSGSDIGNAINVDNAGNVVITGEFAGTATFGSQTLTSLNGSVDVFTAKLDANGNFLWAKKGSAHATDRGIDVACDPSGNVYVTGQFTDTITFDNTYQTNMYNAIFVVKYNANGLEQWFRRAGAAAFNVVNGIAVDASSNVYITGDFSGNLIFFGSPNTTLTHAYTNRIFLAKYNSSGSLLWTTADGSDGEITSRNLALDQSGAPFIVGSYKCRLGSYSDQYGEGIFNSIGFWDIYMAKYSTAGQWQWARSFGGRQDDLGNGITVDQLGEAIVAGTFQQQIYFPVPDDFEDHDTYPVYSGNSYCSDSEYKRFRATNSSGNTDAVIAKVFDADREPYDYYWRTGSGCDRSLVGVCIGGSLCPDTLTFCGQGVLSSYSNTIQVGPSFTYQWSTGSGAPSLSVNQSGYYSVTQTSADGCFVSEDSAYAVINPNPDQPLISDGLGINVDEVFTEEIILCAPDSVLLTASGFGNNPHGWSGSNTSNTDEVWATEEGNYFFSYTDQNGCMSENSVSVIIDSLFPPVVPEMICITDMDGNDSLIFCEGQSFSMHIFDTISNPSGLLNCIEDAVVTWNVNPATVGYSGQTSCGTWINTLTPEQTGEYLIEATILRINHCDTDMVMVSRSIYVELLPLPNLGPLDIGIIGDTHLCPGDSILLVATEAINYLWGGSGIVGSTNDSVWVFQQGTYTVSTNASDTNEYGCIASVSASASVFVQAQPQPVITMQPGNGVICPNDSVIISCNGTGDFQWQGPSGPIGGNESTVPVNVPGIYYCIRTDQYDCEVVSNSVEVDQYATPFILTSGEPILCEGETIDLSAVSNPGSTISWQPPLSGNSISQTVSQAGTYSCFITSCGIETEAEVNVVASEVTASISVVGSSTVCEGDSVILQANEGQSTYTWNPNGTPGTELTVFETGSYSLTTTDENGCTEVSEPVDVTMVENNLTPPLASDTAICPNGYAILTASAGGVIYWYNNAYSESPIETGSTYITPNLNQNSTYYVQQKGTYCTSERASVQVEMDDCEGIETPNVFSPNGDGINDVFYFPQKGGKCFRCRIYSRWGRLLYEWTDQNQGWDGSIQPFGGTVQDGVYYYLLDYCDYKEMFIQEAGFLEVLGTR